MKRPHSQPDGRPQPLRREQVPTPEDAPLASLFAKVEPLGPLPEIAVQRLRRRLERALERPRAHLPLWLKASVASMAFAFVLEAAAATVVSASPAARHRLIAALSTRLASHSTGPAAVPAVPDRIIEPIGAAAPLVAPSRTAAEAPVPSPARPPAPQRSRSRPVSSIQPSMERPALQATEDPDVALYTRALSQLNVEHDPTAALGTLEAYRFQHPNGLFRGEAAVAEVRAELLLHRNSEALALLDAMQARAFEGVPQASELRLLRAELLGQVDRCGDALPVLAEYLADSLPAEERERARYARACCLSNLGDLKGSERELRDYLSEFPQGRFASKVRQSLANSAK